MYCGVVCNMIIDSKIIYNKRNKQCSITLPKKKLKFLNNKLQPTRIKLTVEDWD